MPLLTGKADGPAYDAIHGAYLGLQRSVTMDDWKLIVYPQIKKARLYNIGNDPFEKNDLAHEAKQSARIKKLFSRLLAQQKQMGDTLDLEAIFPKL